MIWVVGDIHGLLDPLKALIFGIETRQNLVKSRYPHDSGKIDKIIFLGDYIDYGPSSKEVIDFLLGLPFNTVFLAGNHEDLLLQFIHKSEFFKRYGNIWLNGNYGQVTINSFRKKKFIPIISDSSFFVKIKPEEFKIRKKYFQFFNSLKYSHREIIGGEEFIFTHAGLISEISIEKQLEPKNYKEFHSFLKEENLWIENSILWTRREPVTKFGKSVVIHGHTPTFSLSRYYERLFNYPIDLNIPYCAFEVPLDKKGVKIYPTDFDFYHTYTINGSFSKLISINVDTGGVFGKALTAIGLPDCKKGKFEESFSFEVVQVNTGMGFRRLDSVVKMYDIKFSGFKF